MTVVEVVGSRVLASVEVSVKVEVAVSVLVITGERVAVCVVVMVATGRVVLTVFVVVLVLTPRQEHAEEILFLSWFLTQFGVGAGCLLPRLSFELSVSVLGWRPSSWPAAVAHEIAVGENVVEYEVETTVTWVSVVDVTVVVSDSVIVVVVKTSGRVAVSDAVTMADRGVMVEVVVLVTTGILRKLEQNAVADEAPLRLVTSFVTAAHFCCGEAATRRPEPKRTVEVESFMMQERRTKGSDS